LPVTEVGVAGWRGRPKVVADILTALDAGDFSILLLLHLTAAFDTVHHDILHHISRLVASSSSSFVCFLE